MLTALIDFPVSPRKGGFPLCGRFDPVVFDEGWRNGYSNLIFSVNKNFLLYAVDPFGSKGYDYAETLMMRQLPNNLSERRGCKIRRRSPRCKPFHFLSFNLER